MTITATVPTVVPRTPPPSGQFPPRMVSTGPVLTMTITPTTPSFLHTQENSELTRMGMTGWGLPGWVPYGPGGVVQGDCLVTT